MQQCIIVDSLPVVGADKYEKLLGFLRTKFTPFGKIVDISLPKDENTGLTYGYVFIQYSTPAEATAALVGMNGKPMDKTHSYKVCYLNDFDKVADTSDTYTEPDTSSVPAPPPFLNSWLLDRHVRDQFLLRTMERDRHETHVFYSDPLRRIDTDGREFVTSGDETTRIGGRSWTERQVDWSASGSYLVTYHEPGIGLWGGANFARIARLTHDRVAHARFSPCDRYVLTASLVADTTLLVKAWSVATGTLLRQWDDITTETWAHLQWSHDGRFLASVVPKKGINIYETPSMAQLDGKMIPTPNVEGVQIAWSPVRNVLAYTLPNAAPAPSVVILMDLPSRRIVAEKHKFDVVSCSMTWQKSGHYLAVQYCRRKTKKNLAYTVDLFNVRKRDVPVEEVTLNSPGKFAFDPVRPYFSVTAEVLAAPGSPVFKCELTIYRIPDGSEPAPAVAAPAAAGGAGKGKKGKGGAAAGAAGAAGAAAAAAAGGPLVTKAVGQFTFQIPPHFKFSHFDMLWSPAGGRLICCILAPASTAINLIDCSGPTPVLVDELEHDGATELTWDPSGRYFSTAVTRSLRAPQGNGWMGAKMEDGYRIWSFQGQIIAAVPVDKLFQLKWRPRPPTSLTAQEIADIKANLRKDYWKKFNAEDEDIQRAKKAETNRYRNNLKAQWREFRAQCARKAEEEKEERKDLRHGYVEDDESHFIEIEVPEGSTLLRLAV